MINLKINKIFIYFFSLISVLILYNYSFADDIRENESETAFQSYRDNIILRPFFLYPALDLTIGSSKSNGDESKEITYKPNSMINIGTDVSWKGWGASINTDIIQIPGRDTDKYGKTSYLDLQLFYYFRKFNVDVFFQKYNGYYLDENYSDNEGVRSDLKMTNLGINITYIFSDNFSFRSSFSQTERQIKSGGSFIVMSSYNFFNIKSDYSLIPPDKESYYAEDAGYKGGDYNSITLLGGYSFSFVFFERWYFTIAVLAGGGWMYQDYIVTDREIHVHSLCSRYNNRIAFGYNGEKYFAGMLSVIDIHSTEPFLGLYRVSGENLIITRMSVYGQVFAGIRF